jgi:ParB family chromosome partitioning protein
MAKRKRLELPTDTIPSDLETKSAFSAPRAKMPIADVAGDVAGRAALEEVAREMTAAEGEGRIVKKLPLSKVSVLHLSRDRMILDEVEMEALTASIGKRGQQTPIEVVPLPGGKFGLISGLRRMEALKALGADHVLALVRTPETSQAAYQAMIEENEIRANLSFYERANIAVATVGQGVYPDARAAVKDLFAHAPRAKRSKIVKFVTIRETLGDALSFPAAIPEHLGLALAQAIIDDPKVAGRISSTLKSAAPEDAAAERKVLEAALKRPVVSKSVAEEIAPGLTLDVKAGRAVLSGKAINRDFIQALRDWAASR